MTTKFNSFIYRLLPPKNLLPLLFSRSFDSIATSITGLFFAVWLNDELISSYFILAVVLTTPSMLSVVSTSIFSSYSDKTGRRKDLMFFSRMVLMLQYFLLIFLQNSIWIIFAILIVMGLFTQIYYVMSDALATSICPPERRGEISSFQLFFSAAGGMIGSGIASVIYETMGIKGNFGFGIGFAFIAGFLALFLIKNPFKKNNTDSSENNNIIEIEKEIQNIQANGEQSRTSRYIDLVKNPQIKWILIVTGILSFGVGPFGLIPIVYLESFVGLSKILISISGTIATLIGMVTLLIVGKAMDRIGRKPFFLFSHIFYPFYFTLFLFLGKVPPAIIILWILPIYPFRGPSTTTMIADLSSEKDRGKAMNLLLYIQSFSANIGGILGCLLADNSAIGLVIVPLFPALITMISATIAYFTIKETKGKHVELPHFEKTTRIKFRW
ncbi:MAG: MFS transporter [Candidatus Thorarchaeota archaeon]